MKNKINKNKKETNSVELLYNDFNKIINLITNDLKYEIIESENKTSIKFIRGKYKDRSIAFLNLVFNLKKDITENFNEEKDIRYSINIEDDKEEIE